MPSSLPPHERYVPKLFPGSSHAWALKRIETWRPSEKILDVGIGSGVMGSELRGRGFENVIGVEIDASARQKAAPLYKQVCSTLNEAGDGFSHALLLDVLEHVANPAELLKDVAARLVGGGTILISVPNVTHWALRLMLLTGYFRYTERGPLDKTHLRFFSVFVLSDLIKEQNLELGEIVGSIVPLELMVPGAVSAHRAFEAARDVRIMLAREFPSLFGYQLMVEVKKRA